MTLLLYDQAIERKLKKLYPNVIGAPPDEALWSSNKNGKVTLPLISFYRTGSQIDWSDYNDVEMRKGWITAKAQDGSRAQRTQSIAMNLSYQIDLWAADRTTADNLFHDVVFALMVNPDIRLDMGGTEEDKIFSLRLTDQSDSTEVANFLDTNRVYRYTLTYTVNRARLMNQSTHYLVKQVQVVPAVVEDKGSYGVDGSPRPVDQDPNSPDKRDKNDKSYGLWSPGVKIIIDDESMESGTYHPDIDDKNIHWVTIRPDKENNNNDSTDYNDDTNSADYHNK